MKTKGMILGALLCLIAALALPPAVALADTFSLSIGNATLANDSTGATIRYFKNADFLAGNPTGNASDWNAYYEPSSNTLYLKDANLRDFNGTCVNVTRATILNVNLTGTNVFSSSAASGQPAFFTSNANNNLALTISASASGASLTAEAKSAAFGISAGSLTVASGSVTGKSAGTTAVLAQTGDLTVSGGSLTATTPASFMARMREAQSGSAVSARSPEFALKRAEPAFTPMADKL